MPTPDQLDGDSLLHQSETHAGAADTVQVDRGNESDISPPRGHAFPIVGVGASAGGLDAFRHLLKMLRDNTGMAFVLVQHLDPHHESQLPELLATSTTMPVRTVEDGMAVRANEVFVIPPNKTMVLEDGVLRLAHREPGLHLPIDAFFESLARVQGGRAIAIVLSGNASDGSQGVKAIKAECGLTFAQDEATAQHVGMPRSAIATGAIDYVMSPEEIARELGHLSQHPFVRPPQPYRADQEVLPEGNGTDLKKIFSALRTATKVDFSHYKQNTIRRRIGRRMIVKRKATLAEYAHTLGENPEEVRELYRDLLIGVTSFFRDKEVFEELRRLLKDVLSMRDGGDPFRVWVPGCATGEELYSLAICLRTVLDELELGTAVQLFGTDISELALDRARAATYPEQIAQDLSADQLRRFFVRVDRGFQVTKAIRETCIFARQDITSDPPFSHIDLLSCRNLLIYLDASLQRRVLPVFHYSLNPGGMLLLGSAESIATASDLFTPIDKQHRIYGRKPAPVRIVFPLSVGGPGRENFAPAKSRPALTRFDLQQKVDLVIQSKYVPAAVVVDSAMQILHFRGRTGLYLEPASGEPSFHLLKMLREGLAVPLRKALEAASSQNVSVRETGVGLVYQGERRAINLEITPISGAAAGERYFLIVFEEAAPREAATQDTESSEAAKASDDMAALEARGREMAQQLAELRENLRNSTEDYEASSEELRAANEEVRSANEELQSTNEELSTTKEELQSANEELTTLNEELQNRNHDLDALNGDLINLLSAVDIAFLMVDNELRLRRFSVAAEKMLNIRAVDIGHPVTHLTGRIDLSKFGNSVRKVIETLAVERWELQDEGGRWYSSTVRPYRTIDNRIGGAVIVFIDIDPLKRTLQAAEEARNFAEGMIETVREPLLVLDGDLRIQRATAAFYDTFQVSRGETEGRLLYDLGNGQWNVARLREEVGEALFRNKPFQDFEVEHDFPHIGRRTVRLNARRISRDSDDQRRVLLAIEDVTERREQAELRYQRLFETAKDGMLVFDAETEQLIDVNPFVLELTGYRRERLIGRRLSEMEAFREAGNATETIAEARSNEIVRHDGVRLLRIDGRRIETELVANRYLLGGQEVVQVNLRDVTKRNRAIRALKESEERFRLFVDSVSDYALVQMDPRGRIASWNSGAERLLGYGTPEIIGQPASTLFVPEDVERGEPLKELATARTMGRAEDERWHLRKDRSRFFASGVLTTVRDEAGRLRGFAKVMRDITDRKGAEEQLRQQARLLELAHDVILVRRMDGTISFWNSKAATTFGWSKEEALGRVADDLLQTEFPAPRESIETLLLANGRWEGEFVRKRRDGSQLTVWSRLALQFDSEGKPVAILEISSDITARKLADRQLRDSLREKEVLLKEIHHRVKNNLQVITSLLSLQSDYIADSAALAVMDDMKNRVRSIAAIHEILYGSTDLSRIEFAGYLSSIGKDLQAFYSVSVSSRAQLEIDSEPVCLDITQAVPCGLIANELLTNSFKHAFPDGRPGLIKVAFRCVDNECTLEVSDDGVGIPAELNPENAASMGMQLVTLLVRQLRGKLELERGAGSCFRIVFTQKLV